jgi:hypothetical protein
MENPQITQITQIAALWTYGPVARKETARVQPQALSYQAMPAL